MLMRNYYEKRKKKKVEDLIYNSLLRVRDFNVRVTVVDKEKSSSESAWKEVFRDAIGGGIINDNINQYYFEIFTEPYSYIYYVDTGADIINKYFDYFKNKDIVRLDITKLPVENNKPKSWIVIRV